MTPQASFAAFFVALIVTTTGAMGQSVYRCGNTYSEKPCPDGVAVNVQDARTAAQQKESAASIRREVATAESIEKARLKEVAQSKKNSQPATATSLQMASSEKSGKAPPPSKSHGTKKKEPEYFTARSVVPKPAPKASASK